jgi:enamine deaminase RidA (YjgF/YER057c/UK114 family)
MQQYFKEPYPPRTTVAVASLPRNARVEIECMLHLGSPAGKAPTTWQRQRHT